MSMHPFRNYFKEYKGDCEVFVETGTNVGDGITLAVLAGFKEIHSIDIVDLIPKDYSHGMKEIYGYIGDSPEVLKELLPKLNGKKIMFWLDAHSDLINKEDNFPLFRELDIIENNCHNATILIDDYLYMSHPLITGNSHKEIEKKIKRINPDYKIEYLPNPVKNNILIAYL